MITSSPHPASSLHDRLIPWLAAFVLAAVLVGGGGVSPVAAQQSVLKQAKQKYQFAEYGTAISLFRQVADNEQADVSLRQDALRYLARAYVAQGEKEKARSAVEQLVDTEPPAADIDPNVEPPTVYKMYYKEKKEQRGSYEVRRQQGLQTMAIMDFSNNSISNREKYAGLRKGLPSIMINSLTGSTDLQVIERERIEWLLNELKLQRQEDKVDQSTAVKTGELLGANAVVFGSYIVTESQMSITARVVKVETGEVLFGDQVRGEPGNFFQLIEDLSQKVTRSINVSLEETKMGSSPTKSLDAMMAYSDGLTLLEEGKYRAARDKFEQAISYDEDFGRAKQKLKSLQPMLAGANTASSSSLDE